MVVLEELLWENSIRSRSSDQEFRPVILLIVTIYKSIALEFGLYV